jgi:hypothetical protein
MTMRVIELGRYISGAFEYKFGFAEQPSNFIEVFKEVFGKYGPELVEYETEESMFTTEDDEGNEIEEVSESEVNFIYTFHNIDRAIEICLDWVGKDFTSVMIANETPWENIQKLRALQDETAKKIAISEFWDKYMMFNFALYMIKDLKGKEPDMEFVTVEF